MARSVKKISKTPKMKEMRVSLSGRKKKPTSKAKKGKMSFKQWLAQYVEASGGNPV